MNSKPIHAATAIVTPDGIIPSTYYDDALHNSSCCSSPYVSAPSSPGRAPIGYFYSAPASPMHFLKSTSSTAGPSCSGDALNPSSFEFDFDLSGPSKKADVDHSSSMSSADELFLNGQIRPMKLSSHLQRPQNLAPLIDIEDDEDDEAVEIEAVRGRDFKKMRDRSLRRRARSLSPFRSDWNDEDDDGNDKQQQQKEERNTDDGTKIDDTSISSSSSPSRSSSAGRNSKRWVFLKDFMRSKSDGSNSGSRHVSRFWSSIPFSHGKSGSKSASPAQKEKLEKPQKTKLKGEFSQTGGGRSTGDAVGRVRNGIGKRRTAHEAHYAAKRAQAEEMRRKTYLPYRQGLLGCLGFSSKGYGAMNGLARAVNSVSSR